MSWDFLYGLDLVAIATFILSYYTNCYRKGYRIDLWHSHLFLFIVLPYMLLLPFSRSELNALVVGKDFQAVVLATPAVFLVTLVGYFATLAGGALWSVHLGAGIRKSVGRAIANGSRGSMMLMSSPTVMILLAALCLSSQIVVLGIYFATEGVGFNLRGFTFSHPGMRPITQISTLCSIWMTSHCIARYLDTKQRSLLVWALLLNIELLFSGSRSAFLVAYMSIAICYIIRRKEKIRFLRILFWGMLLSLVFLYAGNVREGGYSLGNFFGSLAVLALYGNSFCDLRDFAWIYNAWNHDLWLGKTYLAGLATFAPRGISEFRATWSFGIATNLTVGLDTELHPGLRPGEFGEMFFNFGIAGVIVLAMLVGIVIRRVDLDVKAELSGSEPSIMNAFARTIMITVIIGLVTSLSFPSLYALSGLYAAAWLLLKLRALMRAPQASLSRSA